VNLKLNFVQKISRRGFGVVKHVDMGINPFAACVMAVVLLQGCASSRNHLVLDPIGPPPGPMANSALMGELMVFSAFDAHAHFNDSRYKRWYSDYKIFSDDGALLPVIHNNVRGVWGGPKPVKLRQGNYRVLVRANAYGWITVPVVIRANDVTTIHLEGGYASWASNVLATNAVRLPDGRIAGSLAK
jgi:hypothetical protein